MQKINNLTKTGLWGTRSLKLYREDQYDDLKWTSVAKGSTVQSSPQNEASQGWWQLAASEKWLPAKNLNFNCKLRVKQQQHSEWHGSSGEKEEAVHQCREGKTVHARCCREGSKGQSSDQVISVTPVEITDAVSSVCACVCVCITVYLQLCLSFLGLLPFITQNYYNIKIL